MKHAGGRPTVYKPSFNKQAFKLCLLGAIDKKLADFFEISVATLNTWKKVYPKFLESIRDGRETADATVADSLYKRANGYSHRAIKIMVVDKEIQTKAYIEHYPPDSTAAIFWLKNRQKENWRDKSEVDTKHTGTIQITRKSNL